MRVSPSSSPAMPADHPALLESLRWTDEIVVVDSGSTDRTPEICREFGAIFTMTPDWPGQWPQKTVRSTARAGSGSWRSIPRMATPHCSRHRVAHGGAGRSRGVRDSAPLEFLRSLQRHSAGAGPRRAVVPAREGAFSRTTQTA